MAQGPQNAAALVDETVTDANTTTNKSSTVSLQFTNDFTPQDKELILGFVTKATTETLNEPILTTNDLTHIGFVAHGSIKSRAQSTKSAREIILGIINGTRAVRGPAINAVSVKSFLESLPAEEKEKMLQELLA